MLSWLSSMRSKPGTWLLHLALATIVAGACVTHFFGEQGEIHLRADKAETIANSRSSVSLFLWDFRVVNDAQGNPADFISELRLLDRSVKPLVVDEGVVRMNRPLKYHGWRFCQSDYDSDQLGVVLSYNYDPWGIGITYCGYAMLLMGMIAFFFQKRTYFRTMLKSVTSNSLLLGRAGVGLFAVLVIALAIIMTKVVTPKPPLQPVLQTPLLGIHVSVIMLAYTLFAVMMVNGILGLCMPKQRERLMQLSQLLLYPALFCLTAGIFIGAVWANMSWGRYWGWDPKETWALITMLVYAALLHWPWLKNLTVKRSYSKAVLVRPESGLTTKWSIAYHACCVMAFLLVLFTYFGVSYLLGGLHSYAN